MSYSIDSRLLLYSTDSSSQFHRGAREFLLAKTSEPETLYLAWPVVMAYLRMATHGRLFRNPLTPEEAIANITNLLELPRVRMLSEKENFLSIYKQHTGNLVIRGNMVPAAHLAALLFQHGIRTLYTVDPEFQRFDFLTVKNPLEQEDSERKWWRPQGWLRNR